MKDILYQKKQFLNWFLENNRLKSPEMAEVLKLLMSEEKLLKRVRFVEDVRHIPNALLVSAEGSVTVSYLCRLNGVYFENTCEILAALINNPPEEIYVWLSYDKKILSSLCYEEAACEREMAWNPQSRVSPNGDAVTEKGVAWDGDPQKDFINKLEVELNRVIREKGEQKARLLVEIDEALEKGDRERFLNLAQEFRRITENN